MFSMQYFIGHKQTANLEDCLLFPDIFMLGRYMKQPPSALHIRNNKGFSLVEGLIAVTILAGGAMVFGYFYTSMNSSRAESGSERTCRDVAQASLNSLRSIGYENSRGVADMKTNSITQGTLRINNVKPEDLWPQGPISLLTKKEDGSYEYNGYRTIVGSMSVLAGIYNSNPEFCTSSTGLAYDSSPNEQLLRTSNRLPNSKTKIRIQRYSMANGSVDCGNFFPRPKSEKATYDAAQLGVVKDPPGVTSDYGFQVTITTTYGEKESCSASSIFQYPRLTRSALFNSLSASFNFGDNKAACLPGMNGVLKITAPQDFDKTEGMILLCQDASQIKADYPNTPKCAKGGIGRGSLPATMNTKWVPCDEVTACGVAATQSSWSGNVLTKNFDGLPWGCTVAVNMRLVDPAMNTTASPVVNSITALPDLPPCIPCSSKSNAASYCAPFKKEDVCKSGGGR